MIGAGSVVTKNVGSYEIWAGNPARLIRRRFDEEIAQELEKTEWWNYSDEKLTEKAVLFNDPQKFMGKE